MVDDIVKDLKIRFDSQLSHELARRYPGRLALARAAAACSVSASFVRPLCARPYSSIHSLFAAQPPRPEGNASAVAALLDGTAREVPGSFAIDECQRIPLLARLELDGALNAWARES